jgi:hypothetical protein
MAAALPPCKGQSQFFLSQINIVVASIDAGRCHIRENIMSFSRPANALSHRCKSIPIIYIKIIIDKSGHAI